MKTNLYIVGLTILIATNIAFSQDYHFSQFDAVPNYINPALTGERLTDYKGVQFNANFREQKAQYSKGASSYQSIAVAVEEPINSKFSLAQFVYNNKSATGSFNSTGFMLTGAYKLIDQSADKEDRQNLSVGLQLGVVNKTILPENFTYDAQYSTSSLDGFDRSLPTGETYNRQSSNNFNVNFGIYYRATSKNKKYSGFGGFSIYNISQPNESFFGGYSPLPLRYNLHGGGMVKATDLLTIMPQLIYMRQAQANELNFGLMFFYKINKTLYEPIYGVSIRNKDAIIFQLGLRYKGIVFRTSYDVITNNYLREYRNQGLEFSFVCTLGKKGKGKKIKESNLKSSSELDNL
jgi:type IX secretion system PorP/SprF family membrane protein